MSIIGRLSLWLRYNYSNSKRMRRYFWVDLDKVGLQWDFKWSQVELCWSKAKAEEEPQALEIGVEDIREVMSLRDSAILKEPKQNRPKMTFLYSRKADLRYVTMLKPGVC